MSVCPKKAMFTLEYDFPYSPAVVWDYITKPEYRAIMNVIGKSDGCISQGTTYQCAHGNNLYLNTVVDWRPTEQYTVQFRSMLPKGHSCSGAFASWRKLQSNYDLWSPKRAGNLSHSG
ncbi:MAG TPA: hypothetical protein DDY93_05410 [Dehalococcoidia bacterium]|nr:hypothetical protein [Dehalococcoidia bacterium]